MDWKKRAQQKVDEAAELARMKVEQEAQAAQQAKLDAKREQERGALIAQPVLDYARAFYDEYFSSPLPYKRNFYGRYFWFSNPEGAVVEVFEDFFISDFWCEVTPQFGSTLKLNMYNRQKGLIRKSGIWPFRSTEILPTWQFTLYSEHTYDTESGFGTPGTRTEREIVFSVRDRYEAMERLFNPSGSL